MNPVTSLISRVYMQLKRINIVVYLLALIFVYILGLYLTRRGYHPWCNTINISPNVTSDGQWVTVISDTLHTYSAYVDDRDSPPVVKVFAIGVHRSAVKSYGVYCQVRMGSPGKNWIHVTLAKENVLPVRMGRRYEGIIFACDLPPTSSNEAIPSHVSLTTIPCSQATQSFAIHHRRTPFVPQYNFTMCLSPIHSGFSNTGELLGYLEMNQILGADHFILYNLSIGSELSPLLDSYKEEGLLEVLEWKIPVRNLYGPVPDIHYFGQLVAINDCLYRSRLHSNYVVFTDMDEVMAPLQHENWLDLLSKIRNLSDLKPSAFVFRNTFFRKSWESDPSFDDNVLNRLYHFFTMTYTKRETYTLEHIHSKVIGDPNAIKVMAIHSTHTLVHGYKDVVISEEQGLLFHYRSEVYGRLWTLLSKLWREDQRFLVETRMFHFSQSLFANVRSRLSKLGISTDDVDQSQKQSDTSSVKHYLEALNFMLQTHPWAKTIIYE